MNRISSIILAMRGLVKKDIGESQYEKEIYKMKWTCDVPKMNGFYWLRRKDQKDTIVKIRDIEAQLVEFGAMVAWIGSDWDQSLCDVFKEYICQWCGPLYAPSV